LDAARLRDKCASDPGPNGYDYNQELSPLDYRKPGERLALSLMSDRLKSARLPSIFTRHTACYGALGASKNPCDGTFVKALLAECNQLPNVSPLNTFVPGAHVYPRAACLFAVNALSFTMAPGVRAYVTPLLASIDIPFVAATDLANGFLDWHHSKWDSVSQAKICTLDFAQLRSSSCIP